MTAPKVVVDGRLGEDLTDAGRDYLWGEGNWVRCEDCPKYGAVVYHHKNFHRPLTHRYPDTAAVA